MRYAIVICAVSALLALPGLPAFAASVNESIDVAPVWAGHPVGFALLTHGQKQFVGFYDAQRRMTIASRELDSEQWTFQVLPTSVGWDSHNNIVMTLDNDQHLHIAGNMHGVPLIYFRTTRPLDVTSLEKVDAMVGRDEKRCTYPKFLRGPADELIFTYRDGGSGNGNQIYNVYDPASRTWSRLLDQPLTDGQGKMNAYFHGPARGPDGYFHLVWVWRDTPDCATNHDLSYARSRDLRAWETSAGKPLKLPITIDTAEIVDPVPAGGGMINGNTVLGFDAQQRPIISYHKHDSAGHTQIFSARLEDGAWKIYQVSDWTSRWDFRGNGTMPFDIRLGGVRAATDGTLTQWFQHAKEGSGTWTLDPETLKPIAATASRSSAPARPADSPQSNSPQSDFPGMQVKRAGDSGKSPRRGVSYQLRWETLGINQDRPRPEPHPAPSMLRVEVLGAR